MTVDKKIKFILLHGTGFCLFVCSFYVVFMAESFLSFKSQLNTTFGQRPFWPLF